jgi:hypothetical protein
MIVEGRVIIVSDSSGIVEVFGRESDFTRWQLDENIDLDDYEVEVRAVNFSLSVEVGQ